LPIGHEHRKAGEKEGPAEPDVIAHDSLRCLWGQQ
jgi:hypothetical protein